VGTSPRYRYLHKNIISMSPHWGKLVLVKLNFIAADDAQMPTNNYSCSRLNMIRTALTLCLYPTQQCVCFPAYETGSEWVSTKLVLLMPNLMNSARLHKVFQNFVVPWKIHIYKSNYIISRISMRRVEWYYGCLCKYLPQLGPTTRLKIILKLQQFPKYDKIDYYPTVNRPSDWDRNMS